VRWFQKISGNGFQNNCFIDSFLLCVGTDDTLRPMQVAEIATKLHTRGLKLTGTMTDFGTDAPLMVVDQIGGLLHCCYRVYIHYYNAYEHKFCVDATLRGNNRGEAKQSVYLHFASNHFWALLPVARPDANGVYMHIDEQLFDGCEAVQIDPVGY
jgi:hypothetical protein